MKAVLLIPCFNFERGVPSMLDQVSRWHGAAGHDFLVCTIDDGSTDRTADLLQRFASEQRSWFRCIRLGINQGKGEAIKKGFELFASEAEFIFFTDCDLHYGLPILTEVFMPLLERNDIVIADRSWVGSSNHDAASRRLSSYVFNRVMSILTGVTYRDSQAGCKGFRSSACAPIFELLRTKGFAFDVEILSLARFYRFRIAQVPVRFRSTQSPPEWTSIRLLRAAVPTLLDLFRINVRWKRGCYKHPLLEKRIDDAVYLIEDRM